MTLSVGVRTVDGGTAGALSLDRAVFGIEPNVSCMHQVVTAQLAAARAGTQSTKTRAEVSGGGKKPFKQKGTGRARQGSTRAPHWSGGGVALGPKPRSYRQKTPKKMVQLALRSALSDRASSGNVVVIDEWGWDEPSTAAARRFLADLGLPGRVLVVLERGADEIVQKSFRNLAEAHTLVVGELNAYDVLCSDWVVFSRRTLPGQAGDAEVADTEVADAEVADTDVADTDVADTGVAGEGDAIAEMADTAEGEAADEAGDAGADDAEEAE